MRGKFGGRAQRIGFERFIAFSATDHGVLYGLATVLMAVLAGWVAAIVFRRD